MNPRTSQRGPALRSPEAVERALAREESRRLTEQDERRARTEALYVSGRLLIALVFLMSAGVKAASFDDTAAPGMNTLFWLSITVELVAGSMLALGLYARRAALVLLVWIGIGVLFLHGDLGDAVNRAFTLANLAIGGGLFVLVSHGAGMLSVDHWLHRRDLARQAS
jgi:putative oxidoreductase